MSAARARVGVSSCALLIAAALLGACRGSGASPDLSTAWIDALNSHQVERVSALLAPDASYTDPVTKGPVGRADFAARLAREWRIYHDQVYTVRHVHIAPGATVVEWTVQQTHPTGKHIDLDGVTVLIEDRGSIREVRTFYNPVVFLQFLDSNR